MSGYGSAAYLVFIECEDPRTGVFWVRRSVWGPFGRHEEVIDLALKDLRLSGDGIRAKSAMCVLASYASTVQLEPVRVPGWKRAGT